MNSITEAVIVFFVFFPFFCATLCPLVRCKAMYFVFLFFFLCYCALTGFVIYLLTETYPFGVKFSIGYIPYVLSFYNSPFILIVLFSLGIFLIYQRSYSSRFSPSVVFFLWSYVAGLMCIILSYDAFNMFVSLEIISLSGYALVGTFDQSKESIFSAYYYVLYGIIASSFLLFGLSCVYNEIGTVDIKKIHEFFHDGNNIPSFYFFLGVFFIGIGLFIKMGIYPFSSWMVRLYQFAPSGIIVLFSSLTALSFVFSFTKFFLYIPDNLEITSSIIQNGPFIEMASSVVVVISCISIVVLSVQAVYESIYKKVLALSSSITISYLTGLTGLFILLQESPNFVQSENLFFPYDLRRIFYICFLCIALNHCFSKSALFIIGDICNASSVSKKDVFNGLWHRNSALCVFFIFFIFSLIGIPPAAVGFFSKAYLYYFAFFAPSLYSTLLLVCFLFSGMASVLYLGKFLSTIFSKINTQHSVPGSVCFWQYNSLILSVISPFIIAYYVFIFAL